MWRLRISPRVPSALEAVTTVNVDPFKPSALRPDASRARGALQLKRPAPIPNECTSESPTVTRMAGVAIRSLDDHVCHRVRALTPMGEYQRE